MSNTVILSCFNDGNPPLPFKWAKILSSQFNDRNYSIILLLHGQSLKYSLNSSKNPWKNLLEQLHYDYNILIVVCELCLLQDSYTLTEVLPFIEPIPFSID